MGIRAALTNRTNQIVSAVWIVLLAFIAYLVIGVVASRQSTEKQVRDQALSYARLVEQHASAALDRANTALIGINDHLRSSDLLGTGPLPGGRRRELEELLVSQQQRTPGIVSTFLTRADGRIVAISLRADPGTDLSDRAYFQKLKQNPAPSPVVSEVVYARVSKIWGAMVARRVNLPDGSFGGMVAVNLGLTQNFSDFYSTLGLGTKSTVSLVDSDDRLLVRYPVAEGRLGQQLAPGGALHMRLRAGDPEGTLLVRSSIDHTERIYGFRKLADYPIYAVVGLSREENLSLWRRNRNNVALASLLIVLAGVFITIALRRKERAEEALRHLNETLEARVRDRTKELSLANRRTVNVLEEERRRLARELHDRVSSNLTAIGLNLENVESELSGKEWGTVGNALSDCAALAADSAASARDISADLHPSILDYMGVLAALKDFGEKFEQRTGIPLRIGGSAAAQRMPADMEIALFRIAQEALMNCAKHSKAHSVVIGLDQDAQRVKLSVTDDGAGFRANELRTPGLGLLSMQERAQAIGGSCRIDSAPGEGTLVTVEIPLP